MLQTALLACDFIPARDCTIPDLPSNPNLFLHCDVIFGIPSDDCRGTGICKITGTHSRNISGNSKHCQHATGMLIKKGEDAALTLLFPRHNLCSKLYKTHFWKGESTVEESYSLSDDLCVELGISSGQIPAGKYTVKESAGLVLIELACI